MVVAGQVRISRTGVVAIVERVCDGVVDYERLSPIAADAERRMPMSTSVIESERYFAEAYPYLSPWLAERKTMIARIDELVRACTLAEEDREDALNEASRIHRALSAVDPANGALALRRCKRCGGEYHRYLPCADAKNEVKNPEERP